MADAAEGPPTKRQRLTAELEQSEAGRHVLETVSCSICTEVFEDPVSPRGSVHTYCRVCIRQALAVQPRCPLSNAQITIPRRGGIDAVLDGNHQVRSMIESQPVTCKYASHGCTARPALESIDAHEATCPHKPVACSHERCRFVGSRAETAAHEKVCPFVLLGPVLDAQAAEIRSLQGEVRDAKRWLRAEQEGSKRLKARLEALEAARSAIVSPARRHASEDDVREARALFTEGMRHCENKRWPEAVAALQKCVALDANHSEAWCELGFAYNQQNGGKSCEAEYEPYTRCIALDPKHARAHNNLGGVLKEVRKDFSGAERHYRKAIELGPTALRYSNLGNVLQTVRKDYDGAERHYRKAIELDPKLALAHNGLGTLLQTVRKDYDGAESYYRKAIELDPKHAEAHFNLGQFLQTVRKDYDGAEKMFRKAIELDPKYTSPRWGLSQILEEQKNDIPGAVKLMEEVIRLGGCAGFDGEQRLATLRRKLEART